MEKFDRGPLIPYEVIWADGRTETVHAHHCTWNYPGILSSDGEADVALHAEIDGRWGLVLGITAGNFRSVRRIGEPDPDAALVQQIAERTWLSIRGAKGNPLPFVGLAKSVQEEKLAEARCALAIIREHEAGQA